MAASPSLPNFTPGTYDLVGGDPNDCGSGNFELRDNGANVGLGVWFGFDLGNKTETIEADIPELNGCVYKAVNKQETKDKVTVLTYEEILSCHKVIRHRLTKRAQITSDQVIADEDQKGNPDSKKPDEPTYSFRCVWKLHTAAGRSGSSTPSK
jgi:hypothetical protein